VPGPGTASFHSSERPGLFAPGSTSTSGREVAQYFDDYKNGVTTEKRSFRFVQLKSDGKTVHTITECIDCTRLDFSVSDSDASSKDPATWMLKMQPEDTRVDTDG
jgi:hypothetical protein